MSVEALGYGNVPCAKSCLDAIRARSVTSWHRFRECVSRDYVLRLLRVQRRDCSQLDAISRPDLCDSDHTDQVCCGIASTVSLYSWSTLTARTASNARAPHQRCHLPATNVVDGHCNLCTTHACVTACRHPSCLRRHHAPSRSTQCV